jgi:hypothetical protein
MVEWIKMRERALIQFRNGSVSYLITTDLAAGLDIRNESCYPLSFAFKRDEFTHRNGRSTDVIYREPTLSLMRVRKMEYINIWDGRF